jgi:hypothetical protein
MDATMEDFMGQRDTEERAQGRERGLDLIWATSYFAIKCPPSRIVSMSP